RFDQHLMRRAISRAAGRWWMRALCRCRQPAARRDLLGAEHMLDTRADAALRPVRCRLSLRQRVAARRAHMDAAAKASPLQRRLIRGRAIGAVSEHVVRGVALVQKPIELAAVM